MQMSCDVTERLLSLQFTQQTLSPEQSRQTRASRRSFHNFTEETQFLTALYVGKLNTEN